jgi:hypothetical protein
VGNITTRKLQVVYSVKSIVDINSIIIPQFYKYPYLTQKQADFLFLKKIVELVIQKHPLREEGLIKILEFKASQ